LKRASAAALLALLLAAVAARAGECDVPAVPPSPAPAAPTLPPGTRVGIALGSGSMHGYAHIGVLEELEARKLPVHVVAGTSVGALVGALWASGLGGGDIDALARREDLADLGRMSASWQGLLTSDALRAPLAAAFHGRPIEAWPRRFGAVATNIANGERRIIASGDGVTAIQASSAVPVLYRPIVIRGERLVDGALVEPVPVGAARDLGANFVIGVDVGYRPNEAPAEGMPQYAFQAMHILVNSLSAEQMRSADVAIRLNLHKRWTDCGRDALVAAGRDAVRRAWPDLLRAIALRARHAQR
jgi:NTE family protein